MIVRKETQDATVSGWKLTLVSQSTETVDGVPVTLQRGENGEVLTAFERNGFLYEIFAPNGYWGDSARDVLHAVLNGQP